MKQQKHAPCMMGFLMLLLSATSASAQFTLTSPNASTNWEQGKTYNITWTSMAGAPPVVDIELIYENGSFVFSQLIGMNVPSAAGSYSYTVPPNKDLGHYYTVCMQDGLETDYTCSPVFSVVPASSGTGGIVVAGAMQDVKIYPMPITAASVLQFYTTATAPVQMLITDMTGREVKHMNYTATATGIQTLPLAFTGNRGLYLLHVQNGNLHSTYKILVP